MQNALLFLACVWRSALCVQHAMRLLSKAAFICNICFLLAQLLRLTGHPPEGELISLIIILGYGLAMLINAIVNVWYAVLLISRKPLKPVVPVWLIIANFLFFIIQLILFLT